MTTETSAAHAFPVTWDDPKDGQLCWRFDTEHTPDVITPLGYDLYFGPFLNGFVWLRACLQNYYVYNWWQDSSFENAAKDFDIAQLAGAARHFWDKIVPEVEGYTQRYLRADFDELSDSDLAAEIEKLPALRRRMGRLHTLALFPHGLGMRHLIETYKELVAEDDLAAVRLVQGHGNRSIDAGRALWQLSRLAASITGVRDRLLRVNRASAGECMAALQREPEARPFLEALASFLDDFGWRTDLFEFATPAWAEDPQIPLCQLRSYLEMPDYDPVAEQERLVAEREEAIADTLARLPPEKSERLRVAIEAARHVVSLQEDHNFYIDQRCAFSPRRLVLAAARRLVSKGALAGANDVFYLRSHDLLSALAGGLSNTQSIADRTAAEMQRWSAITPPKTIGAPPSEEPAPVTSPLGDHGSQQHSGNGASAGIARGPARVLMSLAEADRLRPGDVLVARTTMPAWTPLFAAACAVVTETGGVLSHAAVVAREYGIPAVLNVVDATRVIRDGQLVEVDGTKGIIRIIS
jgi:phosphohistidine swiveling domain-containing protein